MTTITADAQDWSLAKRFSFRFLVAYVLLYCLPFPLDGSIPWTDKVQTWWGKGWEKLVPWVGRHVLHLAKDIIVFPNGSGDTTFNYVQILCYLVLALLAAAIWSALDRRRTEYARLSELLRVYVRYVLAITMFSYGLSKVFQMQFPAPYLDRLVQPYGDSSPMGLLWTFMGGSGPYTTFGGLMEVIGGVLLLWRRTTTLGALVIAAVMTNVVMMNFCYDVPVKLYSTHLALMSLYLLAPDARRLLNVLLLNRATEPLPVRAPLAPIWKERSLMAVKTLFIGFVGWTLVSGSLKELKEYGPKSPKPALYGLWNVETFVRKGETVPPLLTDATRWRRLTIDFPTRVLVRSMTDGKSFYGFADDPATQTLTFTEMGPDPKTAPQYRLHYQRPDHDHLVLDGDFKGEALHLALTRTDETKFLLVNRGFHWINEYPFNR